MARTFTGEPHNVEPHKHADLDWYDLQAPPQPLTAAGRGGDPGAGQASATIYCLLADRQARL
jgi:hypothetical protein